MVKPNPLTVATLMEHLSQMPPETPVFHQNTQGDAVMVADDVQFDERAGLVMFW